ncbi:MAG: acetyl-CoA carboxylase biotin carboxyl carrier protein [Bacteroidetes bacterium]|nr:acetyl-CoA carboxylase biotin carboxyl carrier protein [Bacteroidota bacterium]
MDLKEIQTLIKFISSSLVDEVSIEQKDFKINIKRNLPPVAAPIAAAPQQITVSAPAPAAALPTVEAAPVTNTVELKSPMIGTFYRKSSPDKPVFVEVGDIIEKGQVICIIEAMKLFNEIEAEASGKVVKILVDDSQPVEYDQPLLLIEPV